MAALSGAGAAVPGVGLLCRNEHDGVRPATRLVHA